MPQVGVVAVTNRELAQKLDELDRQVSKHDTAITEIIEAIRRLMVPPVAEVLLHGFIKKSQKIAKADFVLARQRKTKLEKSHG